MSYYAGKKVLITGGSKGIGRAAAVMMAKGGADVWVAARGQEALDETLSLLKAARAGNHGAVRMDVTDDDSVSAAIAEVLETLGGVDVLVCNTGAAITGRIADLKLADFQRMLELNYLGHVRVVLALVPQFQAQRSGHIQLVSSMLGFFGQYGYAAYSSSKFAIVGFAEALRQDFLPFDVGVSVFYPPTTNTPGLEEENAHKPPEVWELESGSGWNKVYEPDEVAHDMLATIERNRKEGVAGLDSAFVLWARRKLNSLFWWVWDREVFGAIKKTEGKPGAPVLPS